MARYHELFLIPATGHFGPGAFDPGPNYGHFFEADIAQRLIEDMTEELEVERIRVRPFELWKAPGMPRSEIGLETSDSTISLHIAFGRNEGKNKTRTWFSDPGASWLARVLAESVADWAKCSNFHHEMTNPIHQANFFPRHAVLIEPFSLASEPDLYLKRIRELATVMALTISEFFKRTDQAQRSKPLGAWQNEKVKADDKVLVGSFLKAANAGNLDSFLFTHQNSESPKAPDQDDKAPDSKGVSQHSAADRPSGPSKARRKTSAVGA